MQSSMLLPKIHRNSMLPPRCSSPPCMNIELNGVIHDAGWPSSWPPAGHGAAGEVASLAGVRDLVGDRRVVDEVLQELRQLGSPSVSPPRCQKK